jgi:acetylornithine deacetylase/succinyl-diaminopimelate desuccinylase-like protein
MVKKPLPWPKLSRTRRWRSCGSWCVAYGFFPFRHMSVEQLGALAHGRDERVDVRDLALAVDCYRSVVTTMLG